VSGRELAYSVAGKVDGLVVMARSLAEHDIQAISRSVPIVVFANNRGGIREIVEHPRAGVRAYRPRVRRRPGPVT
jgi:LacI family transcriptional regulator